MKVENGINANASLAHPLSNLDLPFRCCCNCMVEQRCYPRARRITYLPSDKELPLLLSAPMYMALESLDVFTLNDMQNTLETYSLKIFAPSFIFSGIVYR